MELLDFKVVETWLVGSVENQDELAVTARVHPQLVADDIGQGVRNKVPHKADAGCGTAFVDLPGLVRCLGVVAEQELSFVRDLRVAFAVSECVVEEVVVPDD